MGQGIDRLPAALGCIVSRGWLTLVFVHALAGSANAQAWVSPAGIGSVSLAVQQINNTGHRFSDGKLLDVGMSLNRSVYLEVDYAVTDRWSLSIGLPYVFAKFTDPNAPPEFIPFLPVDQCRCWNRGWQDVGFTVRYNVTSGGIGLTPSVSIGVPSHAYSYRGEAVVGRRLRELRLAVDAGARLDAISPQLAVQGRYSYTVVERVIGISSNRSHVRIEGNFSVSRALMVRAFTAWQRTHGGLRIGSPPPSSLLPPGEVNTQARLDEHDRILRDNSTHVGVGVSYRLSSRLDAFASYIAFVGGTDTHAGRAVTLGVSWPFQIGGR